MNHLIEPGVKSFLNETLKQCRIVKYKYNNYIFNVAMMFFFLFLLGTILFIKYKGKMTPREREEKNREKQRYILSTIKKYQDQKRRTSEEMITGLPTW